MVSVDTRRAIESSEIHPGMRYIVQIRPNIRSKHQRGVRGDREQEAGSSNLPTLTMSVFNAPGAECGAAPGGQRPGSTSGMRIVMTAPPLVPFDALTWPPLASTIALTIARPMPVSPS
jgi:hypothetical protein